jgi:hypothetical protein
MEINQEKDTIHILTSEKQKEKMLEIQAKLQDQESAKARKLLATAMSHFEAMKLVRGQIEKKVLNGSYQNGYRLFKD